MTDDAKKPTEIDIFVGKQIKLLRDTQRMSQSRLANSLGITFQQVQKYERGSNRVSASRLAELADIFGVPVQVFFPEQYRTKVKDSGAYEGLMFETLQYKELLKLHEKQIKKTLKMTSSVVGGKHHGWRT